MCIVIDAIPAAVATTTVALTIVTATGTTIFETISAMVREGDLHMCREGRCGIPLIGFGNRVSNDKRLQSDLARTRATSQVGSRIRLREPRLAVCGPRQSTCTRQL